jgi:hypothetical protein
MLAPRGLQALDGTLALEDSTVLVEVDLVLT